MSEATKDLARWPLKIRFTTKHTYGKAKCSPIARHGMSYWRALRKSGTYCMPRSSGTGSGLAKRRNQPNDRIFAPHNVATMAFAGSFAAGFVLKSCRLPSSRYVQIFILILFLINWNRFATAGCLGVRTFCYASRVRMFRAALLFSF